VQQDDSNKTNELLLNVLGGEFLRARKIRVRLVSVIPKKAADAGTTPK
jgi:hypothetical protein